MNKLKNILEAVLLATDKAMTVPQLENLFELDEERPTRDEIRKALHEMEDDYETRGYELKQVASGYRLQVRQEYSTWVGRLWEEKPARYTRALLETLALIAYRQPITRGEIEEVRGVSVSSNIIKTLLERDWIKVLGHKDVPGKPSLYGTTKEFLDYFNLKSLDQLPTLAEIKDLDKIHPELELDENETVEVATESEEGEGSTSIEAANDGAQETADAAAETSDAEEVETVAENDEEDDMDLMAALAAVDMAEEATSVDFEEPDAADLEAMEIEMELEDLEAEQQADAATDSDVEEVSLEDLRAEEEGDDEEHMDSDMMDMEREAFNV